MSNGRKEASSRKHKKASKLEKKQQELAEKRAALTEKADTELSRDQISKISLGSQPSAGALATAKKIAIEQRELYDVFKNKIIKDVDLEKLPKKRSDQLAYVRSMKPKSRSNTNEFMQATP